MYNKCDEKTEVNDRTHSQKYNFLKYIYNLMKRKQKRINKNK